MQLPQQLLLFAAHQAMQQLHLQLHLLMAVQPQALLLGQVPLLLLLLQLLLEALHPPSAHHHRVLLLLDLHHLQQQEC